MGNLTITVKTLFGLEEVLLAEIKALGYTDAIALNRAVQLEGTWKDVYRLNFLCRMAISVLVKVADFYIKEEKDLYEKAKQIDWTSYFDVSKTFAVKGAVFSNLFQHTMYPYLVVKDAIADVFRDKTGERPNVNVANPQVLVDVYIQEKKVVISLNTSGMPLFQRGYRQETGEAPINEVLAAGLISLSGWDKKSAFIDPLCGAGTIAIEAALMAADIPAMIEREHYAFKNFKSFDQSVWDEIFQAANRRPKLLDFPIIASDIDAEMVQRAKRNAKVAPIGKMISFEIKDFSDVVAPSETGVLICNPPYGERIGDEIETLYTNLGDFFKQKMIGFNCWIVSSNVDAMKHVGLKPKRKIKVFNGSLECSFRCYEIFEGTKKIKVEKDPLIVADAPIEPLKVEKEKLTSKSTPSKEEKKPIAYLPKHNIKSHGTSKYAVRNDNAEGHGEHDEQSISKPVKRFQEEKDEPDVQREESKATDTKPSINTNAEKLAAMRKYRKR